MHIILTKDIFNQTTQQPSITSDSPQQPSIIKGNQRDLKPRRVHKIFEQTIADAGKKTALIDWQVDGSEKRKNYVQLNVTATNLDRAHSVGTECYRKP